MKVIALGDTHGRDNWKNIVNYEKYDIVVFIGDYFDTHEDVSAAQQIANFKDIIAFKKSDPAKVVLLTGNHDYHYLRGVNESYSGHQQYQHWDIQELLEQALSERLLQMAFAYSYMKHDAEQPTNFLFTHAGVTKTWCKSVSIDFNKNTNEVKSAINTLFKQELRAFKFTAGKHYDNYGDEVCQTPIWVRPQSLFIDHIPNTYQIVGHTTQNKMLVNNGAIAKSGIILIDTLGTSGEYLAIVDDKLFVLKTPSIS